MAGSFADAYVQILPKMADFGAELKRALGGIKNAEVPVSLKFDPGKITQQLADLRKPLEVSVMPTIDDAKAKGALTDLRKPLDISVTPVLDDAKAKGALTDLRKPVDISVTPVIDDANARRSLADLDKPLDLSVRPVLDDAKVKGALADLGRAITVPLEVRLDGKARSELADLTKTETKIIEVDYVSKGGKDPYDSFAAAGRDAGEKAGSNVTAGLAGAISGGMKGPAALLVGGLGIKAIVDSGGDFQVAMQKIQVQTGATAKEMAEVDKITLQLGKDQKLGAASAGDAAAAIQVLTKGQFSLSEAMGIARSALQLSIVSEQGAATATGQLATAMAQLKVPVKDAAAVVDSLAAADLKGIIGNAQDYATAIQYAGTSWTQAFKNQQPLDRLYDLQTALVTLDNQAGITGSAAGTTIRRMMIDMTGPTAKAKEGIGDLTEAFRKNGGVLRDGGTVFVTAAGQMRPLTESIDNLNLAFKGLNPQQVMDLLEPVFTTVGKEGVQLLRDGRGSWEEYRIAIMRAGIASQLADAQATGLKGAFSGLAGALETTAIQTAKAISPYLIPAINGIGTAVSVLGTVLPPVIGLVGEFITKLSNTAPVQGFLDILGRVKGAFTDAFAPPGGGTSPDPFSAAQKGIRDARTETEKWQQALKNLRDEFPLIDAVAGFVETKIVPAFQAIGRVVQNDVLPALDRVGQWVQTTAPGVQKFFTDLGTVGAAGAGAVKFALDLVNAFGGVKTVIEGVIQLFSGITAIISGVVGTVASLIRGDFSGAWNGVKSVVQGVIDTIVGLGKITFGPLLAAIGGIGSALRDLTGKGWKILVSAGGEAKDWILGRTTDVKNLTKAGWRVAVAAGGEAKQWIVDRLTDVRKLTGTAWRVAVSAAGNALQWVKDVVGWLKQIVSKIVNITVNIPGMGALREAAGLIGKIGSGAKNVVTQNVGGKGTFVPAPATGKTSGRAEGGPVKANTPYIVGEEGPELFFPRVSGEIFTNTDSARLLQQAKQKSFDAAGIIAKVLVRTPGGVQGSPTDQTFATLASSFTSITEAVDQATTPIEDMGRGAVDFVDAVSASADDIVGTIGNFGDDLGGLIEESGGRLADNAEKEGQRLADNGKGIAQRLADNSKTAADRIIGIFDNADLELDPPLDNLVAGIDGAGTDAESFGDGLGDVVIDYIVPAAEDLVGAIGADSPLVGAVEDLGLGLGDLGTSAADAQADLDLVNSSGVTLAFSTLANVINLKLFPALDGFIAKLNAFDVSSLGGGTGDPLPVSAVGPNGESIAPTYIVPAGSPSNAETIPGSGGNPNNTPGGSGGPLPYVVGDGVPGAGFNPNNTPGGSGGPISTAPVIPLPGPITNTIANGIGAIFTAIGNFIPNATLLDGRAGGGPVLRGRPYLVGERGPELFVPGSFGNIRTNAALMAADLQLSRPSRRGDAADRVAAAVKEAIAEAGLDRPNLTVATNAPIEGWQLDMWAEIVADKVDQRMARGN